MRISRTRIVSGVICALSALLCLGCTENLADTVAQQAMPIHVASTYPVAGVTRATDFGFAKDDAVGIFVVDYNEDGTSGIPALSGNRASNVKYSYNGSSWKASYQLYWANESTPVDFYGYYPYDENLNSVTDYTFAVARNQNETFAGYSYIVTGASYMASDLLWTKVEKVQPTSEVVKLPYRHLMAGVTVSLEKGSGFTDAEWTEYTKVIQIDNTILSGTVDLTTGTCSVDSSMTEEMIVPRTYGQVWRALVFPQTVESGKSLLSVAIDGQRYQLVKDADFTYYSGKMHNFTIAVNRTSETGELTFVLRADDILTWTDDVKPHDGLVRQYMVVEVLSAGSLQNKIERMTNHNYADIQALKVIGKINHTDLAFIGGKLKSLTALHLGEAIITGSAEERDVFTLGRDTYVRTLAHIIFPTKLKKIADYALTNVGLEGNISIPEGVEYIGEASFQDNNLRGELKLPSTLKHLGGGAFAFNSFSGELNLPDGLEIIGGNAENPTLDYHFPVFAGSNFTGPLVFPSHLKRLNGLGFSGTCGTLVIPQFMTAVKGFDGGGFTQVKFHDGVTSIGGLGGSALSGEVVLPPNLKVLNGAAFEGTKISKIIFPDNLLLMEDEGTFRHCVYLSGTVELPKNVARISKKCFAGCTGITGLVIPENIDVIDNEAFFGCYSINNIVCKGEEPPLVCEDAFYGVNKNNFIVEVPKGCVEKYKQAQGWSEFKRIAEYSNFVCRPAQANALNTAHTETLVLNADGAWTVEHCPDWVTLSKTFGTGKTELRLTFNPMEHGAGNRRDSILFRMPAENHTTYCVVSQYDYEHEEDSYLTLQEHTKGEGIDIVFIGDGFDGESIADGSYLELVKQQTEYFFGLEPYKSHREYFNVYVTFPLSQENGVNTMYTYVNNRFGTLHGVDDLCSYNKLLIETDDVCDYALRYSPLKEDRSNESLVIIVPNCPDYPGNTVYSVRGWGPYGMTISICPPSNRPYPEDTRGVIQHEAGGHGFGKLADEEITYPYGRGNWATPNVVNEVEVYHSWGWYQNIATTSSMKQVPWTDFIFDTRYSDYVDVYEGAYGYMRGIFRSEANSCMNYGIPYYNTISRLSIMRRIFDYAREPFTMDYFYEHDTNKWGDRDGTTRTGTAHAYLTGSSYAVSNQHVAPQMIDAKKQGDWVRKIRAELKKKRDSKRY